MSSNLAALPNLEPGRSVRACPLCGGTASVLHLAAHAKNNRDGVELRRCNCGFVFSKLPPYDYADYWSSLWDACSREDLMRLARKEGLDTLATEILSKVPAKRVLDFGAGIGMTSMVFESLGCQVIATEESERYRAAHRRFGLESAAHIDGKFDLIIAKDVLEHLERPREVLQLLAGAVNPGAMSICVCPMSTLTLFTQPSTREGTSTTSRPRP